MDSNLQHKLQQFSADPPPGVWNKIADALDADHSFAQRLYHYEEQPPAGAWQAVEKALAKEPAQSKVIPFFPRYRTAVRYIAVASLLTLILVTLTLTVKRTEAGALEVGRNTTVPGSETLATTGNQPSTQGAAPDLAVSSTQETNKNKTATSRTATGERNTEPVTAVGTNAASAALREYVTYSDGDGNVMRVSKKMANLLNCRETDLACKKRLQELQQKMATSAMTTDFTGVLDILRKLQ